METAWESELAGFLTELSAVQDESLETLTAKRQLLARADVGGLAEITRREEALIERLQACLECRAKLLERAAKGGLPSESIRSLAAALPEEGKELTSQLHEATVRTRLLRHHSLTNWVLVQRTLIHLSQMLEIIATGGQMQPTYEKNQSVHARGALVDRAV